MTYHITIIDMFHPGDDDAAWDGGIHETAEAAIAAVKSGIDHELKHFWAEEAGQGQPSVEGLVSRYHSFAEMPVAFGPDHKSIFDSRGYAAERAAAMVAEAGRGPVPASATVASPEASQRPARATRDVLALLPAIAIVMGLLLLLVLGARR